MSGGVRGWVPPTSAALLLALIFGWMLLLNLSTPTWGDDWHRTMPFGSPQVLIDRLLWEYGSWTGRVSVLSLTYLLFWQYPGWLWVFNLLNSAAFVLLIVQILRIADQPRSADHRQTPLILFIFAGLWFGTSGFGEAVLWKTGAIAFLWVITAALWLVKPFVDLLSEQRPAADTRLRRWALPFAYAFVAMSLENLSAAMSLFLPAVVALYWLRGGRPPLWAYTAVLGQWLGSAVLLLAPGNFARFRMQDDGVPLYARLPELVAHISHHLIYSVPLIPLLGVLVLLALLTRQHDALRRAWIWMVFAALTALAMVGSTGINFHERTAFVSEVLFIVAAAVLVSALLNAEAHRQVWLPLLGLVLAVLGADGLRTLEQYRTVAQHGERRAELMAHYREAGLRRILLPSIPVPYIGGLKDDHARGRFFFRDIHMDMPGNGWRNGTFAEDHGFEFATRVDRAHLIYVPELEPPSRYHLLHEAEGMRVFYRKERRGLQRVHALYLLSTHPCPAVEARATLAGAPLTRSVSQDNVARVDGTGQRLHSGCGQRIELPSAIHGSVALAAHGATFEIQLPADY